MNNSTEDDLKAEFRLALGRAGLQVAQDDLPELWAQFEQAKAYAKALDSWEGRVKEIEPQGVFVPPAAT